MPSFHRLTRHSNRSQEQHQLYQQQPAPPPQPPPQTAQQLQQLQLQQQQQQQQQQQLQQQQHYHQQQQHHHQQQPSLSSHSNSAAAPPPVTLGTARGNGGGAIGVAISGDPETLQARSSTIAAGRIDTAAAAAAAGAGGNSGSGGGGSSGSGGGGVSDPINTFPSASSTGSDSFQLNTTQQGGQQYPPLQPPQSHPQSQPHSQSLKQRNRVSQHFYNTNNHNSPVQQDLQGPPQQSFGGANSNLSPAAVAPQLHQHHHQHQHHNPIPLNQPTTTTTTANSASGSSSSNHHHNTSTAATAYTTSRSLQQQQQDQQDQQQSQSSKPTPRDNFADLVSRSQSARQSQTQVTPIQTQLPYGAAATSLDNLPQSVHLSSPIVPPQGQGQSPNQTPPIPAVQTQAAPTEQKRSARRLFKTIISAARSSEHQSQQQQHQHQKSYDNTSSTSLTRRPSKRHSKLPSVRTDSSQVSFEETPPDWQAQNTYTQPSPLQSAGETDEQYLIGRSNQDHSQNSIRHVPADVDSSPYSQGDQTQQKQQQQQQQLYGRIVSDPAQSRYQYVHPDAQHQGGNRQTPYAGQLSTSSSQLTNPETVSQLSHDSPVVESDQQAHSQQPSQQTSPAVSYAQQELLTHQIQQQPQTMAPPPGGPAPNRRPGDSKEQLRASNIEPPPGPPPNYRHSQSQMGGVNNLPPTPAAASAAAGTQSYRSSGVGDRQQFDGPGPEAGRNSPQPAVGEQGSDPDKQFKDLLTKYKNVKRLYFDGKAQVEQLNGQVETLQNAVANQRMSQSRTSLDDNEYSTRFNRLNGAINNLAFNIRKDWRSLPPWIENYVSPDAIKTGKQEMTAVGRAVIIRWIVDEVFNKCFHPGLDFGLSGHLKAIEQNIRRFSYTLTSQEEFDALTAKVVNWRMATLEGLQHMLQSPESNDYRADFTKMVASNLTAALYQYLNDPPPPGVDGSASMIVELVVGIAANLPMESRDVVISYPLPGDPIQPDIMEPEKTGLPPLADSAEEGEDSGKDGDKASKRDKTKSGMLTMLGGTVPYPAGRKGSTASVLTDTTTTSTAPPAKDPTKIRFAGFLAVEVRGRQVLVKAPVWTLG